MIERYGLEQAQEEAARLQEIARKENTERNLRLKGRSPEFLASHGITVENEPSVRLYDKAEKMLIKESLTKHSPEGKKIELCLKMIERGMTPSLTDFAGNTIYDLEEKDTEEAESLVQDIRKKGVPKLGIMNAEKIRQVLDGEPSDDTLAYVDEMIGHSLRKIPEYGDDISEESNEDSGESADGYNVHTYELLGDTAEAMGSLKIARDFYEEAGNEEKLSKLQKLQEEMRRRGKSGFEDPNLHSREEKISLLRTALDRFLASTKDLPENKVDLEEILRRMLEQFD